MSTNLMLAEYILSVKLRLALAARKRPLPSVDHVMPVKKSRIGKSLAAFAACNSLAIGPTLATLFDFSFRRSGSAADAEVFRHFDGPKGLQFICI